jgi:hypothetical protein
MRAHFITRIKCDSCTAVAFSARKLRAASMDVPVVHYGGSTLPRATPREVARPEQASQPRAIRQGATCHSVQRREAEAGAATNRTSVSRHVTLSARREAEAGVATTSGSTNRLAAHCVAPWVCTAHHTHSVADPATNSTYVYTCTCYANLTIGA